MPSPSDGEAILLFDGVCNSCEAIVRFVMRNDPARRVRFARLQSDAGRALLRERGMAVDALNTLVVVHGPRTYAFSAAAFELVRVLGWPWKAFAAFSVLPVGLTDAVYRLYARNRYRLFGRSESCRVLTAEEKALFLEGP
jgi:predicted DCC family thiol-disulfide oxidoreductase YuxK